MDFYPSRWDNRAMIENAPSGPRHLLAHWKFGLAGLVLGAVAVVLTLAHLAGILTVERHRDFFAPVWAADSNHVYLMERRTSGIIWGFGWEHFTPPAYSYVLSDRLSLVRFNAESGALEVLEHFDGGPVQGRITRHYRNRIFNTMSARLLPMPGTIDFRVRMDLHKVPRSEPWSLSGVWRRDRPSAARWVRKRAGNTGAGDHVLRDGLELILIKGREAFPAAIIAANADGSYQVLIKNGDFDGLYPDGVPARMIAQRTRRKPITRIRARRRAKAELMAKYRAQGLNEGAASLRAHDDMEARGLYPKSPRLVATLGRPRARGHPRLRYSGPAVPSGALSGYRPGHGQARCPGQDFHRHLSEIRRRQHRPGAQGLAPSGQRPLRGAHRRQDLSLAGAPV